LLIDILAANRLVQRAHATSLPGVLLSDTAVVPFAWGRIVVPCGMQNRDAVIAHEAAHLERGDVWTSIMARVACAIYWFHPLVWWGASRMRLEADRACDDAVLQAGFSDAHYAQDLVEVARTFSTSRLAPGAIQESQVAIRVRHILSTGVDRRRLGTGAACVAVIAGALVFSPLAALSKGTSALDPNDKVYKVASGIAAPSVLYKIDPQYSEDARKLKLSGSVLLKVVVGKDGIAHDIKVVRPLIAGLDANAVAAVKRWKFRPGIKNGEAVNVSATIEVNFRLK
jgi:TonB family protein